MSLSSENVLELFTKHVTANYGRAPINLVRGEGSVLWDAEGKRYLDLLPGLGVNGLGHCPPRVVKAVQDQVGRLMHVHNNYIWEQQGMLAEALASKAGEMGEPKVFFCNSGSEASETAIKMARLWGKQNGGKWKIIALENSFHGRTFAAITATGQPGLRKGLDPMLPGFSYVPINDVAALETAFDEETVAFMAEPVQGEGGIHPCTTAYLKAAKELCAKRGALLLYDEVQCGMGRTGDFYAYQTLGAPAPDVIWLAKALGGGFPIGAAMARDEVAAALVPGTHGSTFGGNPMACAAALAVIETIEEEGLLEHVREVGRHFGDGLDSLKAQLPEKVKEIRRVGLMTGLDLRVPVADIVTRCRDEGLLINGTHDTVLRFLPAMNVSCEEIDEGLSIVSRVLENA